MVPLGRDQVTGLAEDAIARRPLVGGGRTQRGDVGAELIGCHGRDGTDARRVARVVKNVRSNATAWRETITNFSVVRTRCEQRRRVVGEPAYLGRECRDVVHVALAVRIGDRKSTRLNSSH